MIRNLNSPFAASVFLAAVFACSLPAATVTYTVTNLTASGGDPTYSIATDVTFNSLSLRETFADSTTSLVSLYDFTNTLRTSLDTLSFDLHSLSLNTVDPTHGNLLSAVLTGTFSQTALSIVTSFGATPVPVTVNSAFTTTLPLASASTNILAATTGGASYAAGTLQSATVPTPAVPEPATAAIASLGLLGLFAFLRHKGNPCS